MPEAAAVGPVAGADILKRSMLTMALFAPGTSASTGKLRDWLRPKHRGVKDLAASLLQAARELCEAKCLELQPAAQAKRGPPVLVYRKVLWSELTETGRQECERLGVLRGHFEE